MTAMLILLSMVGLLLVVLVVIYNQLGRMENMVQEGWSGIDVQLKRRGNLIPNIVDTVKGYMQHERELFSKVTELRTQSMRFEKSPKKAIWKERRLAPLPTCSLWRKVIRI